MTYTTPGVYVEEKTPTSQPIIGVGTTTPVFIGFHDQHVQHKQTIEIETGSSEYKCNLEHASVMIDEGTYSWKIKERDIQIKKVTLSEPDNGNKKSMCTIEFVSVNNTNKKPKLELTYLQVTASNGSSPTFEFKECKNFTDFKTHFGDFTIHPEKRLLAHAVSGFFENGGKRCYVCRANQDKVSEGLTTQKNQPESNIDKVLKFSECFEDISLVIPIGKNISGDIRNEITQHCHKMKDRFAIFHFETKDTAVTENFLRNNSEKAAVYHPWVKVFDPASKEDIDVPPSGHVAGIYARVDDQQGVQKAPANEIVIGVKDVSIGITKEDQDTLNPKGINCIRVINGKIKVWGARTLNPVEIDYRYINVCRSFMYLSESIEKGTQWAVFQPNTIALRQQIVRNITDFLLIQWRAGMLFGETQQEAFRVQCDAETNSNADQGELRAIVQVALVRPAEFIIIQISHKQTS